jgi:ABC-type polysaccharide/polyol phosphate transport system ATPase subunit
VGSPTLRSGTIEATEIWKRFRADVRSTYLQDELARAMNRLKRNYSSRGWRWALRDISLSVEPGSSVGLIGANGSGKSTLLKILARVMQPTAGRVTVEGRVGALIEIRAGMHPNLSGRENIFFTGSIMGLPRREVARRFDEIVAFAQIEHAIDRQVKYYSSGMQMRLGFGVAAFLEPSILLVDEVLAVGDASFQQRCLDRMREVMTQGTTLFFVSHDLGAVEATCSRGVWLNQGVVVADGPVRDVLGEYRAQVEADAEAVERPRGLIELERVTTRGPDGSDTIRFNAPLAVDMTFSSKDRYRAWIFVGVSQGTASPIFVINPGHEAAIDPGRTRVHCQIDSLPLPRGRYYLWCAAFHGSEFGPELMAWQPIAPIDVYGPEIGDTPVAVVRLAPVHVGSQWEIEQVG